MTSRPEIRATPLQVLHLSMPRTGSLSMKKAYEALGLPTYHGFEFIERADDQIAWFKAVEAKWHGKGKAFGREEFDEFLGQWAVLSDMPVIAFSEELLEAYPEAKVVLVGRDIDRWYTSYNNGVIPSIYNWKSWIMLHIVEHFIPQKPATTMTTIMHTMFNCSDIESYRSNAKQTYRDHYAKIRKLVPKERLLEYELGSEWEPLCRFLGKEVPNMPFPHLNEGKEFEIWLRNIQTRELRKGLASLSSYVLLPTVVSIVAWLFYKM